jgi:hypothetical protein
MEKCHPLRRRLFRFAPLALTILFGLLHTGSVQVDAQARWSFRLLWEQDAPSGTYHRLCVNGQCSQLSSSRVSGRTWTAPLPMLAAGEYTLVVESCVQTTCVAGVPDLVIRVLPPSPRRGPIDVISGGRIPVGGR